MSRPTVVLGPDSKFFERTSQGTMEWGQWNAGSVLCCVKCFFISAILCAWVKRSNESRQQPKETPNLPGGHFLGLAIGIKKLLVHQEEHLEWSILHSPVQTFSWVRSDALHAKKEGTILQTKSN